MMFTSLSKPCSSLSFITAFTEIWLCRKWVLPLLISVFYITEKMHCLNLVWKLISEAELHLFYVNMVMLIYWITVSQHKLNNLGLDDLTHTKPFIEYEIWVI